MRFLAVVQKAALRLRQGFIFGHSIIQVLVKGNHQVFRPRVVHRPQGGDDAFGARVGESLCQADDALAALELAAGAERDPIGVEQSPRTLCCVCRSVTSGNRCSGNCSLVHLYF